MSECSFNEYQEVFVAGYLGDSGHPGIRLSTYFPDRARLAGAIEIEFSNTESLVQGSLLNSRHWTPYKTALIKQTCSPFYLLIITTTPFPSIDCKFIHHGPEYTYRGDPKGMKRVSVCQYFARLLGHSWQMREELLQSFMSGKMRPISYRKEQLSRLAHMVQDHIDEFRHALNSDLGRSQLEADLCAAFACNLSFRY